MALRETLELDLGRALTQLDSLEAQLDGLLRPIVIPVDIAVDQAIGDLRSTLNRLDQTVDVSVNAEGLDAVATDATRLDAELDEAAVAADRLDRELDQVSKTGQSGLSAMTKTAIKFGVALGGLSLIGRAARGLADFAGDSIAAASDLAESTSKAEVVFGEFSDTIFEFTGNAPAALGVSTQAAIEMTGTFGNLFTSLGLSREAAADLSPDIVQLGADLASFNNLDVEDALLKLRAGLVGEVEPLRSLGVSFLAADVERKAFELGLQSVDGTLTEAAKVQARYALIVEQTGNAQGDFARTADGVANRQRTLNAEFDNFTTRVGQALIPAYEALLAIAPQVLESIEGLVPVLQDATLAVADFFQSVADAKDEGTGIVEIVNGIGLAFGQLNVFPSIARQSIGALFDAVTQDSEGFADNLDDIRTQLSSVFERGAVAGLVNDLEDGVDASDAFAKSVGDLSSAFNFSSVDDYTDAVQRLGTRAGLTDAQLASSLRIMIANADQYGIAAGRVDSLVAALRDVDDQITRSEREPFAGFTASATEAAASILTVSDNIDLLQSIADEAGISVSELVATGDGLPEFADALAGIPESVQGLGAAADVMDQFAADFASATRSLADSVDVFAEIPDTLKLSKQEFLENLSITAADQAAFNSGLAALFQFAPRLAQALQEQGPSARQLVIDFLADATGAAQAEAVLAGNAAAVTSAFGDGLRDSIVGSGIDAAGAEALLSFLAGFADPATIDATVAAVEAELARQLSILKFGVDVAIVPKLSGANSFLDLNSVVAGSGGGGGGVTVNINNATTTDLATNAGQLAQIGGAIGNLIQ